MLKLLDIVPYPYLPYYSGGQKSIAQFLEYLGTETDLTVIGSMSNDAALVKNYLHIPLLKRSVFRYTDISLIGKIVSLIQKNNYDAVIWEHPYYYWLANRIKKRTGIRTIVHTHNIEYLRFKSNLAMRDQIEREFSKLDPIVFQRDSDQVTLSITINGRRLLLAHR